MTGADNAGIRHAARMRRPERPDALGEPQLTSDALSRGATRYSLGTDRVEHPVHGVVAASGTLTDLATRCRAIALTLPPTHAFSHPTGAELQELPIPWFVDRSAIHVSVPAGSVVPDHAWLTCHGQWLPDEHIHEIKGLRCVIPARCYLDLAAWMPYEYLVAIGDHILHHRLASLDQLTAIVAAASRRRGVIAARKALVHLDGRAESPPESITRVWLGGLGLPEVVPQYTIRDTHGNFLARVDLAIPEYKIVIEYQGAYHREAPSFAADIDRRRQLRRTGHLVVEIQATHMGSRWLVIGGVVEALRERGWVGQPQDQHR